MKVKENERTLSMTFVEPRVITELLDTAQIYSGNSK